MASRNATLKDAPKRSNFYYALSLLPKEKREAMRAIYDFCRHTDDLADNSNAALDEKKSKLDTWREDVRRCYMGTALHPLLQRISQHLVRYNIPEEYLLTLIDGVEMDLTKTRYETFEELKKYCYAVASVVGLMSLQVFGYKNEQAKAYAICLGYALQLTNILRDISQDAAQGRIYIPLEDLHRFNVSENDILDNRYGNEFQNLMHFEVTRAEQFYAEARRLLPLEDRSRLFAARTMDAIYHRLLRKIAQAHSKVRSKRIRVSNFYKIVTAFRFWLEAKLSIA